MNLPLGRLTFSRAKQLADVVAAATAAGSGGAGGGTAETTSRGRPYPILAYDPVVFPQRPWPGAAGPSDLTLRSELQHEADAINNALRNLPPPPPLPSPPQPSQPPQPSPPQPPATPPVPSPGSTPAFTPLNWQAAPDVNTPVFDRRGTLAWTTHPAPAPSSSPGQPTSPPSTPSTPGSPGSPGVPSGDTSLARVRSPVRSASSRSSPGSRSSRGSGGAAAAAGVNFDDPDSDQDAWNAYHGWQTPPWVRSPVRMIESPYDTGAGAAGAGVAQQQREREPFSLLLFALEYFLKAEQRASKLRTSIMLTRNGAARALLKPQLDVECERAKKKLHDVLRVIERTNYVWLVENYTGVNDGLLKVYQSYYRVLGGSGTEVTAIDAIGHPVYSMARNTA